MTPRFDVLYTSLITGLIGFSAITAWADDTVSQSAAASTASLSPTTDYTARRSDAITHEIDFRVVVTPPYHCQSLKVWLPLPTSDAGQEIGPSELSSFPVNVEPQVGVEPVYGNKFACFEFDHPQGAQIITHRFTAKVWNLDWDLTPSRVTKPTVWPESFHPYLQPQAIRQETEFAAVLHQLTPQRNDPTGDLNSAMDWVNQHLAYDHVHASLQADANHAFEQRRGHCSDYHGLCATMGRRLGHPTRVTYGLSLFPKNSPSHCKLEAYLPPYGWVSYDLSETQKLIARIGQDENLGPVQRQQLVHAAQDRLHQGFRENSWLLLTRGTNYDLVPPASRPVQVVRTIFAEADGIPLPEPDPANGKQREFSWMTAHRFESDTELPRPFQDYRTLSADPRN
ncbi:MAG: transglutaminase domain-containing protein [Planctomycetaceae bacterium]|nr:transglutaminase domain-containing protein [Planctomycetaceae bacterium]